MSRVLITGAGGFIGRHTLAPLLAGGFEVHAVSSGEPSSEPPHDPPRDPPSEPSHDPPRDPPSEPSHDPPRDPPSEPSHDPPSEPPAQVRWHCADLLAAGVPALLMREVKPSHLLHLAWYTKPGAFWSAPENLDWVAGSLALLRAFSESGGLRAVLAGTCAEYAWQRQTHCSERTTPTRPATLYGAAKHALQVLAQAWARQSGVALAWGRVFHLYGPHEPPGRLVSDLARSLLSGEEARCTHGEQVRDFLYAPELGDAFAALLACEEVTGPLNMASGEPVRVAEVIAAIAAETGRPELVRMGALPTNPAEPERLTADVRRLREEVGWSPALDLRQGAAWTVSWWRHELEGDVPEPTSVPPEPASVPPEPAAGTREPGGLL